jgi:hypothetical protein
LGTPNTQSISKNAEVLVGSENREEEANSGWELSLCCSITLITQSPDEQEEGPKETISGRDNWEVVPLALRLSLREEVWEEEGSLELVDDNWTRVSEMEIWRGRERPVGTKMECWWRFAKDSKASWGREREEGEEKEEERENEEERRKGLTLVMGSWASDMSEVTKSPYPSNRDINSVSLASPSAPSAEKDEDRPDTHMSTTPSTPASRRSSTDNPNSTEALKISITRELIKILESSLRCK